MRHKPQITKPTPATMATEMEISRKAMMPSWMGVPMSPFAAMGIMEAPAPNTAQQHAEPVRIGRIDDKPEGGERCLRAKRKAVPEEAEYGEEGAIHQAFEMGGEAHARIFECAGDKARQQSDHEQDHAEQQKALPEQR